MNIVDNVHVGISYRLTLDSGEEVDRSPEDQPFCFITGSGQIIPGLEKGLMGMNVGDKSKISIAPEDAYGLVNPELISDVPRDRFPSEIEIKPGMIFNAQGPQGVISAKVKEIKDENTIVIDLNHPLAGQRLHFDVNVIEVRELTAEELSDLSSGCGCDCGAEEDSGCGSCGCC